MQELDEMMLDPTFWDDQDAAQHVISESNALKDVVGEFHEMNDEQENLEMTLELLKEEFDEELQEELGTELKAFLKRTNHFFCLVNKFKNISIIPRMIPHRNNIDPIL